MAATLALFALLAIGSARDDVACTTGVSHCMKDDLIGTCTRTLNSAGKHTGTYACGTADKCTSTDKKGDYCGPDSLVGTCTATKTCEPVYVVCPAQNKACRTDTNLVGLCSGVGPGECVTTALCGGNKVENSVCEADTMKGVCESAGGNCKFSESVKVVYTVMTDKNDTSVVVDTLADQFVDSLKTSMTRGSVSSTASHCDMESVPTATAGKITGTVDCGDGTSGTACVASCTGARLEPFEFTKKCSDEGQWIGEYGSCKQICSVGSGKAVKVKNSEGLYEVNAIAVDGGGKIFCPNAFDKAACYVKCTNVAHRVKTQTNYTCAVGADAWTPNDGNLVKGECALSVDVFASANIVLDHDDEHENIVDMQDETFNAAFRAAVVANLPGGVLPSNVIIKSIKLAPAGTQRRLNEKSVQVDYTIRKGDPEGPTDLDGRLPVGGGLRGTR